MNFQKFLKPKHLELAKEILKNWNICDSCLGRQFAQLGTGFTNKERGKAVRKILREKGFEKPLKGKCEICGGFFQELDKWSEKIIKETRGIEFESFVIGTVMSSELIRKEESLWEETGIEYCESFKAEANREIGKKMEKKLGKKADKQNPTLTIILDLEEKKIRLEIKPVFIYGEYQKLVRGIPQTKWDKYPITVEDIIAECALKRIPGDSHAFHGCGREDIDARCLDWRPFVFEIKNPKKRHTDLKSLENEINKSKKIKVRDLVFCDKNKVIEVKSAKPDKTYRVLAEFEKPVKNLEKLKTLKGIIIKQRTPSRVLHRRADKLREKRVKNIKWKVITNKKCEFIIRAEAGLYIKELITGDKGRTKPSVSEILENPAKVLELDVIKIHTEET
ncbi:MAG: tRNA pseudouridine(54/55) synthase Pus10 [Candidatus Aenigmatarchaeota archaeon]|nr:MAG: tRNA pseudouridine(54/55) synthase Pus10 [Candidatus Aenigmarchaeota archaeon]